MKIVFDNFLGGLSGTDRNAPANTYAEGREVDPHRDLGYLTPGYIATKVAADNDNPQIIKGLIRDICVDPATDDAYFIDGTNLYHMTDMDGTEAFNNNFDGSSHYYKAITNASTSDNCALAIYPISTTNYLFYAYQTASAGDIGRYDLSSTFDDDYMSTVPSGAAALQKAPHPILEYKTYLFIGNGRYIAKFDGQTGANGTLTAQALDFPQGWEVTALFPTKNYLGICAWRKQTVGTDIRTNAVIWLWDLVSSDANQIIPVEDNYISAAINQDGIVYLIGWGREPGTVIRQLTDNGGIKLKSLVHNISGTSYNFQPPTYNSIDVYQNRIIFGTNAPYGEIFSYGRANINEPYALTMPWGGGGTPASSSAIRAVKTVMRNKVYTGSTDATNYYLNKYYTGGSTNATYKANYYEPPQKVRINYIVFQFKPLVSGDSVTVSLDTDYGTSNSLGTITYSGDGAITSKRFDCSWITCRSFRPVIQWSAGAIAFSKIIIDFDYLDLDI